MEKIFLFIKKDCFQSKFTGNRFLLKEKKKKMPKTKSAHILRAKIDKQINYKHNRMLAYNCYIYV